MIAVVFAFLPTLGFGEMVALLVLGILLFGRNLPDVGRKLGRTVAQLRRGMQEFKDQMARDESIRELRDSVKQTRDQIARAGTVPRALANPGMALRDLARDTIVDAAKANDVVDSTGDEPPPDGARDGQQRPAVDPHHAGGDHPT